MYTGTAREGTLEWDKGLAILSIGTCPKPVLPFNEASWSSTPLAVLFILAALPLPCEFRFIGRRHRDYPPSPRTVLVLGNVHRVRAIRMESFILTRRDLHKLLQKWAEQNGPVHGLIFGNQTLVVLSSDADNLNALIAVRPRLTSGKIVHACGKVTTVDDNDRTLCRADKMIHALLNVTAAQSYLPYQDSKRSIRRYFSPT